MCGIVGVVDPRLSGQALTRLTQVMADQIVHRGPNDQGHYAVDGFGLGMRRLSIIDLAGGQQPIGNENGDVFVICNGEIYNYVELRQSLLARGHVFRTNSDTEVLVHLYEEYGEAFLQHVRGMFGLAILDLRKHRRLLVARDRLGKKPVFYAHRMGRLLFGSEMKALLAADPELAEPDYRTLGEYLQFGYIQQPRTIYRNIFRLPAAHYAIFENEQLRIQPYWELVFEPDTRLTEQQWQECLDETLAESVRIRLRSDVPLGVFLSGGLDSSAVVAYCRQAGLNPLQTFTIGFDRPEWDESADAAIVARHFGTEHRMLRLDEAAMRDNLDETLLKIISYIDEPFGDASALPTYHVSRLAREHVTVVLSGDGGDEMFAGYSSYRGMLFAQQYRRWVPQWLGRHVLPGCVENVARWTPDSLRYRGLRIAKILRDSSLPMQDAYRDKGSIWRAQDLRHLLNPDVWQHADYLGTQYLPDSLWETMHGPTDLVSRLTEIDIRSYMLDDILVKVDRMSMAHSLEVRSPLLDHRVAELAARMPTGMKIRGGVGKHVLREVLRKKLPPRAVRKGKQGFSVPLRDWFRGRLAGWVRDCFGKNGYLPAEIFSLSYVETLMREHEQGTCDHSARLWLLLAFAAWHRQYQQGGGWKPASQTASTWEQVRIP
jgi:asparagine synthase (glutamine-hydrolysing)